MTRTPRDHNWVTTTWGHLATLVYGKALRDYDGARSMEKPFRVFGTNGPIGWHSKPLCHSQGIIVGRKGAYRGIHFSSQPFFVIDTAFYLKPAADFDLRWAYYQLKNFDINKIDSGAAIPSTSREAFYQIPVHVPPLETQRRITSILSAYDDLIENNTRRITILEEMARRIYEEWFVRFRFPGHEDVRMVESELGLVPEGWLFRPLGTVVEELRDAIDPGAVVADMPYVGLEHLPRRSIALAEWGKAEDVQSTKLRFRERDILFGKIRPYFHKVAVAPISGVASSDAIVIRPKAEDFGLVLAVVSSDAFVAHATQTSNGTKMPRANWSVLKRYPVPTPPGELRIQFEDLMENVVSAVGNHVLRNRNLRTTRDLLLPKLISGELDVSALAEPAAA